MEQKINLRTSHFYTERLLYPELWYDRKMEEIFAENM